MAVNKYDLIFLGGGPAGYQGAIRAAQLGLNVALVEQRALGGVCLNRGCIPTKAIRASAELLIRARQARSYGLSIESAAPDIPAIIQRKNRVVRSLRSSVENLVRANRIHLYEGSGRFLSACHLAVRTESGEQLVKAPRIVVATGSRPVIPPPFDSVGPAIWTSDEILEIKELPARIAIIGAGVVGLEMAFIMSALGSTVWLLEAGGGIMPAEDQEMADYMLRMLKRQRIKLLTSTSVNDVQQQDEITLLLGNDQELAVDAVLLAAGRRPNTDDIDLPAAGLPSTGTFIKVNEHMETEMPGIYAAGDVIGGWMLAHVAYAEGITAAENAAGLNTVMDYDAVPRCIYGIPEFAAVGLSEESARRQFAVRTSTFPFKTLGMAQALGEMEGLIKLVVEEGSGRILGGHIIGSHATELIGEITLAVKNKLTDNQVMHTIHAHPTLSETILEVAQASMGQSIHLLPGE